MNDRIQQLAGQCYDAQGSGYLLASFNQQRFAKLIVQECASIVANAVDQREPASTYADKIKNHFGVEE